MLSYFVAFVLAFVEPAVVDIHISQGNSSDLPESWTPLDSLSTFQIGKSYWAKVSILGAPEEKYVIQGGNWYMQNIHFYNSKMELIEIGNYAQIEPSTEASIFYLFYPFHDSKDPGNFTISVSSVEDFLTRKFSKDTFQIGFTTTLLFVLLVTAFFILRGNDKVYRDYAYYIGSILIFFSYQYGLWGNQNSLLRSISPSWMWIFSASLSYAYTLFARSFLDMKEKDPFNYRWTGYGLKFIWGVVTVESVSLIFHYDIIHEVWYKSIVITCELILMIVFLYRIAIMRTIVSNIFTIGAFVLLLTTMTGQIASTFKIAYETNTFVQIGLLLDVFILAIGIAVRVGIMQKSREEAQAKLIDQLQINKKFQEEYTENLENQVKERTVDLDKRNLENETLLKEVHHRVKNNLQMITSLLNMQQRRLETEAEKNALAQTKNRVKSIGLIHEHLYKHEDFSKINLKEYSEELLDILIKALHKGSEIETTLNVEARKVSIETAIPIGLILNELFTNSIKYAFENVKLPSIEIKIREIEEKLVIMVRDNGCGITDKETKSGFGHSIINTLLDSMSGTMEARNIEKGYQVTIEIKDY